MWSMDAARDYIHVLPPIVIGGRELALEVEIVGAWADGTYVSEGDLRNPKDAEHAAVAEAASGAFRRVRDAVMAARQAQQEGGP